MRTTFLATILATIVASAAGCAPHEEEETVESSDEELSVRRDDLNGIWTTSTGTEALLAAWPAIGVKLDAFGRRFDLKQSGAKLLATGVALQSSPNDATDFSDDVIEGTIDGQTVRLERDVSPKPPITLTLPGDRPFRSFLVDQLTPAAQRDRESYVVLGSNDVRTFLHECVAYVKGYWQYSYLKGATRDEENEQLEQIVSAIDGVKTTPRLLIRDPKFSSAVKAAVRGDFLYGRAVSDLGLYFSTAAGRSIRIPLANDTTIYFITDRPERKEKLGLVLTKSPLHAPLAITFGGQLFELGSMAATDDATYTKALMELLTRSNGARVAQLSPAGRAAMADWYGVMAIEDYRGIAFGMPTLGWGYNFTNAQFYGLVVRALKGQVLVGKELRPGDPSYADILNDGKDMQEYPDMAALKQLATSYLLDYHSGAVSDVVDAFAGIVPANALDARAKYDVFHYVLAQLFDAEGRTSKLGSIGANKAVAAVAELIAILGRESAQLEAYILSAGVTKSPVPAPKVKGI